MHVHATRSRIGHGDDVDVVGRIGLCGLDSGRFAYPIETLAISIDGLVNPVG